ncbi:hypothetical protein ACFL03_10250 [Thermodesulfobacteriota bacterium]
MPYDKRVKTGSKYYKAWIMVNDWKMPSRNAEMSPRLFKNKMFKMKIRTVKPKSNGKPMPKDYWYSVVDELEVLKDIS